MRMFFTESSKSTHSAWSAVPAATMAQSKACQECFVSSRHVRVSMTL